LAVAVEKLAEKGAKMVIISNSSRRSSVTMEKLESLGFDPSCFLRAITSGELTHQYLQKRDDPWFAALGRKCVHLTWGNRGAISLEVCCSCYISLPISLFQAVLAI
jgi:ribonucleotide monophosphatase NagD (HAD superfamily)